MQHRRRPRVSAASVPWTLFTISNSHERHFCSLSAARHSSLPFSFLLATPNSYFPTHVVSFAAPGRGACGAPLALGCLRGTRLGALNDRRAVASLDRKAVTAALRSLRTTAERGSRSISHIG